MRPERSTNNVGTVEKGVSKLLRVDEAAHRLGLKPSTVRKLIYRRQIAVVRPTKRAVRIREDVIDALVTHGYQPVRDEVRL